MRIYLSYLLKSSWVRAQDESQQRRREQAGERDHGSRSKRSPLPQPTDHVKTLAWI
jgi:hypothetical protein